MGVFIHGHAREVFIHGRTREAFIHGRAREAFIHGRAREAFIRGRAREAATKRAVRTQRFLRPRLVHGGFPRVSFEKVEETRYKNALLKHLSVTPLSSSGLPTAVTILHPCPPALLLGPGLPQP